MGRSAQRLQYLGLWQLASSLAVLALLSPWPALAQGARQGPQPVQGNSRGSGRAIVDSYMLGPGDAVQVELLDVPEYSGIFAIGPDGTLYLPRLRALYVEGLTVEELRYFLTEQFKTYVRKPEVYVRPVTFRPIRVYVGGEVRRPGYYYLSGQQAISDSAASGPTTVAPLVGGSVGGSVGGIRLPSAITGNPGLSSLTNSVLQSLGGNRGAASSSGLGLDAPGASLASSTLRLPTVFDAIRAGLGVTPYSDLAKVSVTRRQALSTGGGKIQADLDFLRLLTQGDESQNIRLYDGDVVVVSRSAVELRDQVLQAAQTNLSPDRIEVFVSGRVKAPGTVTLPQGSSLNQALMAAGGPQLLRGPVEFVRFTKEGKTDRRRFSYNSGASTGDYKNPILMAGDIVRVDESLLSASASVLNEFTGPFLSVYSLYRIFSP
jgi:polysaccharide export outer membrane protein